MEPYLRKRVLQRRIQSRATVACADRWHLWLQVKASAILSGRLRFSRDEKLSSDSIYALTCDRKNQPTNVINTISSKATIIRPTPDQAYLKENIV